MSYAIDSLFQQATTYLERERRRLTALDQARHQLMSDVHDPDGVSCMSRALTYVVCAGILEQLLRDLPVALSADIVTLGTRRRHLPLGLVGILEAAEFRKCGNHSTQAIAYRAGLARKILDHHVDSRTVTDFSADLLIADGTTIGTKNFEMLWEVLGLPNSWHNESKDAILLREFTSKRNDVAHWTGDPVDVGRSKSFGDLIRSIDSLIRLIDHVWLHIGVWLDDLKLANAGP